jgi:restriction system protein
MAIPTYDEMFNPVIQALKNIGGSGSVSEIDEEVSNILNLTEEEINEIHTGNRTKVSYRLAWTRNYLKRYGILENSSRGIWALTSIGLQTNEVDSEEVKKKVKELDKETSVEKEVDSGNSPSESINEIWQEKMISLLQKIDPNAFERLCQRILRESGFIQVNVTGQTGDGGIDGTGIMKIGGLLSFHIIFQCKRYQGSVSSKEIRDFRGAMVGRSDKGLFITTGTFTREAKKEASRDGAPPIDLVDGNELVEKMKELGLGVKIQTEESIDVDENWINNF